MDESRSEEGPFQTGQFLFKFLGVSVVCLFLEILTVDRPRKIRLCAVLEFSKFVLDYVNEAIKV